MKESTLEFLLITLVKSHSDLVEQDFTFLQEDTREFFIKDKEKKLLQIQEVICELILIEGTK